MSRHLKFLSSIKAMRKLARILRMNFQNVENNQRFVGIQRASI